MAQGSCDALTGKTYVKERSKSSGRPAVQLLEEMADIAGLVLYNHVTPAQPRPFPLDTTLLTLTNRHAHPNYGHTPS